MNIKRDNAHTGETLATGTVQVGKSGRVAVFLQNELLVDIISCLLLSSGLAMALINLTSLEGGMWKILGLTAASLAVVSLLRIRWWLAPSVAAALLAGMIAYHLAVRDLYAWADYWAGFLLWARYGSPADGFYSENGGPLLLEALFAFAVALAVFALVRRLFVFPLVLGMAAAVLIWVYALERVDLSSALCFSAAGLIVMLPRVYSGYVRRNSEGAALRGSTQLVAVPAALLALLLAGVIIPKDTSEWRSQGLSNFVSDMGQFLSGPFRTYPAYSSNFSLTSVNFQPDSDRLGGPVTPGKKRVAFVNADRPMLLRGAVRDYYTGESWWMGAPDGDLRYTSLLWRRHRRETFDLDKPAGNEARKLFDSLTDKTTLSLSYTDSRFSAIFAAGRVRNVSFSGGKPDGPYFNTRGELYAHTYIPPHIRVNIETTVWKQRTPGFDESFLRLEQLTASAPDTKYDRIFERHTQLPDTLPDSVRETADEITAGLESPYEKAGAIASWLNENCNYNLQPETPPEGTDFVAYFLETREGYCTYYASAMAVMARCAGLPSRYVTGFALERDRDGYLATESTAHAWVEIYFRGIGWMEFDPLAWDAENPLNAEVEPEQAPVADASPANPYGHMEQDTDGSAYIPDDEADSGEITIFTLIFTALGAVMLYFLIRVALRIVMTSKIRAFKLDRMLRRFPDTASCMDHYYADILRQLRLMGLEPRPGETLATFPARVDRYVLVEGDTLAGIAQARMRLHFAGIAPTIAEVESCYRYHLNLETRLRERLGNVAYFFRRATIMNQL